MKLPIQYALLYPKRLKNNFPRFDFLKYSNLTFEQVDFKTFINLTLAFEALNKGGNMPCILNAANEVVVQAFLQNKIRFIDMPEIIENCMDTITYIQKPTYNDYVETDRDVRARANEYVKNVKLLNC
ncbi:MAG: hypothetical protein A3K10_08000 [Bacteroidetes bacterium RIFCSPLOWO2_12_FULL_31_6]|nr:MAG: hypothetical protein A3K10_08000 [Bacteroidetes bacterium RIFCSPLOWO2_12_FULL_31_6]